MKKIRIILVLWLLMAIQAVNAQLLNVRIGSDALVEDAIKDAIVIVESNYCIQDTETNQKYGRNDESYFNVIHFLGCKTDRGIIISEKAVEPWSVDKLFDRYRDNNKYQPILDNTMIVRNLTGGKNGTINAETDLRFNADSTLVCSNVRDSGIDKLMLTVDNKMSINWIVWIKQAADKKIDGKIDLEYLIIKKTIDFSDENVIDAPNTTDTYIGGLYISARVVNVGLVEFSLSGFVIGNLGKWIVKSVNDDLFTKNKEPHTDVATPERNTPEDNLTPMKEKRKKQLRKNKQK